MKTIVLAIALCFSIIGCQQAGQGFAPGAFNAVNSAASSSNKNDGTSINATTAGTDEPISQTSPEGTPPPSSPGQGTNPLVAEAPEASKPADQSFTFAAPNPIGPKSDDARVARGLTCPRFHRIQGSPNASPVAPCFLGAYVLSGAGNETFNFKYRLERSVEDPPTSWNAEPDGYQVRLIFYPAEQAGAAGSFVDTKVAVLPDGNNVSFPSVSLGPGLVYIVLFEPSDSPKSTADYQPVLTSFDQLSYDTFIKEEADKFLALGMLQLIAPDPAPTTTGPASKLRPGYYLVSPLEEKPTRASLIKRLPPSQP